MLQALLDYSSISAFPAGFASPGAFLVSKEVLLESPCPWIDHQIFGVLFSFSRVVLPWQLTVMLVHSSPLKALEFSLRHPVQG